MEENIQSQSACHQGHSSVWKNIDCFIVTAICSGIYTIWILALGLIFGAHLNRIELSFLCIQMLVGAVRMFGFAVIAMIVLYSTKNVSLATAFNVFLAIAFDLMLTGLNKIPVIKFAHLENSFFSGAVNCAGIDMQLTGASAAVAILCELLKVVILSLGLTYILFRKKELDF